MKSSSAPRFGHKRVAILVMGIILTSAAVALSLSLSAHNFLPGPNARSQGLSSFQSYAQLQDFMATNAKSAQQYNTYGTSFGGFGGPIPMGTFAMASTLSTPAFTGTNVQVQGVDEPDGVKTDGTHLFVSTGSEVSIINMYPPNSTATLSTITFQTGNVLGIEISLNRLLVIVQRNSNATHIDILLYNTADLTSPTLMTNVSVPGNYVAARLAQDYLYAVIQEPSFQFDSNENATGVMPYVSDDGVNQAISPSSIYYTPDRTQINYYTLIISVSVSTGKENTLSVLTGPSSTIYVSTSNIYVAYSNYQELYADNIPGDVFTGGVISPTSASQEQNSTIFRASYSNGTVAVEAVGTIPGTVLNQFSMDEYNGYFRVATSRATTIGNQPTISNDVYVLNQNMSQVVALRNIAPGENLYAVRFVGDMGYVVTFQQVDPLFAISFSDVTHPVILSALKVSGYSDYLHPLPGGYLIGVGKDAVPSSTGDFSYYLGLKLSLFRVFDNGTSAQISKYLIGDRGTDSPVLNDHLAFTFDSTNNITVIPVLLAKVSGNQTSAGSPPPFGDDVWQGVYVFKVSTTGFTLLGNVSQYPPGQNYGDSPNNNLQIDRSVIIGDYLYTVSQSEVMVSTLTSFSTVATIQLVSNP